MITPLIKKSLVRKSPVVNGLLVKGGSSGGGGTIETVYGTNSISLQNAKANGLKALTLFGGTEQSGTPTPTTPQDIVSNNGTIKYSANMCNVNAQTALIGYYISTSGVITADANNWIYQDFIPVKPNTTYTLTMSSSVYFVTISEYSTANDSGFVRRNAGSAGDNTTLTIITSSTTNYIRFGANLSRSEVTLETVLAINWMLNEGGTAIPYAPYAEGGIYTDGTVETVGVTGKNLFDKDSTPYQTSEYINSATIGNSSFGTTTHPNYNIYRIGVQPNTTYTFGIIKANAPYWVVTDDTGVILSCSPNNGGTAGTNITITTPANAKYLYLSVSVAETYKCDDILQLELGSTATDYEPYYNGGNATAEMLLKVGDYQDVQSVLDGHVTRNVGVMVLNGTETWNKSGTYIGSFYSNNISPTLPKQANNPNILCSHGFKVNSLPEYTTAQIGACYWYSPTTLNYKYDDGTATVEQFRQWLADQYNAGTPVIVVYPLATPTTETVTGQHLTTKSGSNTISITQASISNLDLEAEYKRGN